MKDKTIQKEQEALASIRYSEYPMVRYLVVFVIGLVSVVLTKNYSLDIFYIFNIIVIVSAGIGIYFHTRGLYYVLTFLTGFFLMNNAYIPIPQSLEGKIIPAYFKGSIEAIEKETDSSMNCILSGTVKIVNADGLLSEEKYTIRLMSFIFGDSIPSYVNIGANIESIIQIQFPKKSNFPTELHSKQVLIAKDIHAYSSIVVQHIAITDEPTWTVENVLHQWRNHVDSTLRKVISSKYVPLLLGMLFDKTAGIQEESLELLSSYGLIHILSASGTHVLVLTFFCWSSLFIIRSHFFKTLVLGILLVIFVLVTGVQISAFRTAIISFTILLLPHISRTIRPLNLFAFATMILLLFQPTILFSYSFYFSTTAIIGIYLCYTKLSSLMKLGIEKITLDFYGKRFLNNVFIPSVSLSLSAGLITNIIGSSLFYKFSISSIIGNTVFLFLYLLAFVSSIITYIFSFLSDKLFYYSGITTSWLLDIANSGMEYLQLYLQTEVTGYSIWIVAVFFCLGILYSIATQELRIFVFRSVVVMVCLPIVYYTAKNLPYKVNETMVYRFQNAKLLPIHQNKETVTYFLTVEPKISRIYLEQCKRFLPLTDKKTLILYNGNDSLLKDLDSVNNISLQKISKQEQFILYKHYLHKKTSQSKL